MMESKDILIASENDESIARRTSLTFDSSTSQPKFDCLLDKLRKGMSELTSKGDDFTKQMFQMYNTLEDIVHSSKMNDNNSSSLDQIFVTNQSNSIEIKSKFNTLSKSAVNSDESLFNGNTKSTISQSNQSFHSSIDSNDTNYSDFCHQNSNEIQFNNNNNNKLLSNEKIRQNSGNNSKNESINSLNTFCSNTSLNVSDCQQNCNNNNNITKSLNQLTVNQKLDSISDKEVVNTSKDQKSLCLEALDKTNGYIKRNCFNSSEQIVNPLLDTINTLNSCSDSSDECDINKKCYKRGERHRRILNGSRPLNRKSCNYYYSSSDGDSVSGYTGTNSLESGYKSDYLGSNTPEVIEGSSLSSFNTALDCLEPSVVSSVNHSVNHPISHQMTDNESSNTLKKKITSKQTVNSVNSSTKPSFDTNSNNNTNNKSNKILTENLKQNQISDDLSSNASIESFKTNSSTTNNNNRKTVGMFSEKIANRLKGFNNDSQLDHLLKLRKSLLKALKRCEQISSPANSRDGSPITAAPISVSSRSSSPASTVVKSSHNSSNSRRIKEDINTIDKYRQKLIPSPLTIRPHEENDCNQMSVNGLNPNPNSDCNPNPNNIPNHSKSVRFNSSVKFSSVSNSSQVNRKQQQISGNYVSNKSILKDPLCETLRSAIKAGEFKNNCSLEGEIDELLYGRTGAYYYSPQLESGGHLGDDCISPSSAYVTMIEEKYRTFTANTSAGHTGKQCASTAAASKKTASNSSKDYSTLKTGFCSSMSASLSKAHELDLNLITTSELRINATLSSTTTTRPKSSPYSIYGTSLPNQSLSAYGSKPNRKSTKTQFTEMAKCMLEILDDLQVPQNSENTAFKHSSARLRHSLLSNNSESDSIDLLMKELSVGQSDTSDLSDISSISYRTLPEQHIYEEILYDCLESQPKDKLYSHYLPSRRTISSGVNTYGHSSVNGIRVDAPLHQSHIRHVGSWGRTSNNKPKQRSNLYTIFADESERRNISRSLEREFCKRKTNDFNPNNIQSFVDNYGFEA